MPVLIVVFVMMPLVRVLALPELGPEMDVVGQMCCRLALA